MSSNLISYLTNNEGQRVSFYVSGGQFLICGFLKIVRERSKANFYVITNGLLYSELGGKATFGAGELAAEGAFTIKDGLR